jgi:4-amino-4-deoxy-L-arabinose transferase-like glycosyltransferase
MIQNSKMRVNIAIAVCAGLGLRLFFVLKYPAANSGDAPFYIELAWNWLKNHVYALSIDGQLVPVDMRAPGYPAFLAAVFAVAGNSSFAVMLAQVVVDLAACLVIALLAARLAGAASRPRVALAALWLGALCPFTANYTAVELTETLAVCLTAVALVSLLEAEAGLAAGGAGASRSWLLAGIVTGLGALVRPETPLVLAAAGAALGARWWRPRDWGKLARAGLLLGVGLVVPLLPWAARNWRTLHEVQFLAPRYSELPGEYTPQGFTAWTGTWMWRMRDVYLSTWNVNEAPILLNDLPASAFDSPEERVKVAALLDEHNQAPLMTPGLDAQFAQIAKERTARHPWRTYAEVPALRVLAMWFTPRTELLPFSGRLTPLGEVWEDDKVDFLVTLFWGVVGAGFVLLGSAGTWSAWSRPGVGLLLLFVAVRTIFFAYSADTSEPRYMLECFPALIALGAQAFQRRERSADDSFSSPRPARDGL